MRYLKYFALLAVLVLPAAYSQAQVAIGVQIGPSYGIYNPPPVCEYGFYPVYPFACAPYGYWGPEWFADGVFIGAGPWYRYYYTRPVYYRPYYFNRGFGRRVGFEHFRGGDRFREREFRSFGDHDRGFREVRRDFRADRGRDFRNDGGRHFGDDRGRGERDHGGFRGDGGHGFRGGGDRGSRSGGGRSYGGGGSHDGGGRSHDGGGSHGSGGGSHGSGGSHEGGGSYGGGGSHGGRR